VLNNILDFEWNAIDKERIEIIPEDFLEKQPEEGSNVLLFLYYHIKASAERSSMMICCPCNTISA
jgi:hypothetical protein